RRFGLVAAVLDRAGIPVGRGELYGAACGGLLVDDPGADLAVAAALASSRVGAPPPPATAFVGEVSLTGAVRPVPGLAQRLAAAAATGIRHVVGPPGDGGFGGVARPGEGRARPRPASEPPTGGGDRSGVELVPVRHLRDAVGWARRARASEPEPAGQAGVRRVGG
ncbi:MAG TPA: S16 family serine protease, partial [Actinomycetota bacterium]|nr:S16 family serine protease [Actinomycetota bacterium]